MKKSISHLMINSGKRSFYS